MVKLFLDCGHNELDTAYMYALLFVKCNIDILSFSKLTGTRTACNWCLHDVYTETFKTSTKTNSSVCNLM